ncbi:hypothetical protein [Swingsia samuiensis]|uniref:Zinc ribbon domain-containing protein n=1 Tax=Swingsia samuiensis TaxID=1293412 RepID=A0A4Y6ULP5_9PROT|nr:hypothetical protein [Swingsia samuiensis]QDH17257.1 hypothetical protein E3D00_06555 [Swingsia samuiensis]
MIDPLSTSIALCPVCRQKIRPTAEHCPHCGAERTFGPMPHETALYSILGMILLTCASTLLHPLSLWTIIFAFIGLGAGFLFAHNRFAAERWIKPKQK